MEHHMNAQTKVAAAHKNVYVALAAAQMEMKPLVKGSVNPAFRSKYADLADLVQAVRQPLNANGLTYFHQIVTVEGARMMRTLLVHGETESRIECDVELIVAKHDMQGMKSATTYAKRIGLESVTGVAPDDDDGNAAAKSPPVVEPPRSISADQFTVLRDLIEETGTDIDKFLTAYRVETLPEFPANMFEKAKGQLERKKGGAA
jgi:hypothetical protein